jgi:hypothetical protein
MEALAFEQFQTSLHQGVVKTAISGNMTESAVTCRKQPFAN